MLADEAVGPTLDGAIIATSHASHYQVGMLLVQGRNFAETKAYRIEQPRGRGQMGSA